MGELGRIVLQDAPGDKDKCLAVCEIAGDMDDPMTERRMEIFGPLAREIVRKLDLATGGPGIGEGPMPPGAGVQSVPPELHRVKTRLVQCERCLAPVAAILFPEGVEYHSQLEDHARMAFPKARDWNVPTWVLGPLLDMGEPDEEFCPAIKIWPEREPARNIEFNELDAIVNELSSLHCADKN